MIGASAGNYHTAVWTDANEILTFGSGFDGEFGHLNEEDEEDEEEEILPLHLIEPSEGPAPQLLPRLVEALLDNRLVGA